MFDMYFGIETLIGIFTVAMTVAHLAGRKM
jgi:hypothetical protein